jgi:hypothetical protein
VLPQQSKRGYLAMNCTRIRVVMSASMTASEKKLQRIDGADDNSDVGKALVDAGGRMP